MTIKILHLIDHYRTGGPGKTIINSAKYIDKTRFSISVSSYREKPTKDTEFAAAVKKAGIPYLPLTDHRFVSGDQIRTLNRFVKSNQIAILHTHGYKANLLGLIARLVNRQILLVSTYHGWISNAIEQDLKNRLDLFLCRFFDGTISVSKEIHKRVKRFAAKSNRNDLIHNAIVIDDYQPKGMRVHARALFDLQPTDFTIGVFGRLSVEKGCVEMIEAFERLALSQPNFKLLFLGEGPLLSFLTNKAKRSAVADQIIFGGYHADISPFYEAIDLFVCPSRTEGISNVILEAMAFCLPVVATSVGGNPEIITHGKNGLLVPPMAPREMAEAILLVAQSEELKQRLAKKAYATATNEFSFQSRMRKVEKFYSGLKGRS